MVKTLVSPDYAEMGAMAAQACGNARPDGASVLMIDDLSSPFVAQMKRDGFMARAEELGNVSLAAAVLADGTEGSVQQATEKAIAENESVNAVFSTEELFYPGALAAVRASGRDISIISVGGGEGVLGEVAGGGLYASVFSSPAELARIAGEDAVILARDSNAGVLSFEWLKLELITRDNAVQYAAKGGYADLLTPVALSPSPSEQAAPEQGTASAET
ncbi:MAG TPA: hypothetical protein DEB31_10250 [Clostridiales bacterium]|nr:hypothetical protein [Clostridiales bacterium]